MATAVTPRLSAGRGPQPFWWARRLPNSGLPRWWSPIPLLAFAKASRTFCCRKRSREPGISPQAFIHPSARVGREVSILPLAYVGRDAVIGDGVVLCPGAVVGERARVGDRTVVHPNVSILHDCVVGRDVILHAGTVVGSDGFGFVRDGSRSLKIPQVGTVQIDDDVEIGANCCIDRATLGKTWIQRGVKTDNLVQIAHNVTVGEDTLVVAQTGISGSVRIGRQVVIGGQVGIGDHVEIGDRAMIGSQSGVAKSLAPGVVVSGTPTMPHRLWLKTSSLFRRLPEFLERLRHLENRLASLEQGAGRRAEGAENGQEE